MTLLMKKVVSFRPPRIAMLLLALATAYHWLAPEMDKQIFAYPLLGSLIITGGFSIMMLGWWMFKIYNIAICPTAKTIRLVTSGIYRITRNPMYLGVIIMISGLALIMGVLSYYIVIPVYFLIIDQAFCPYEEKKLLSGFKADYEIYSQQVPRWL